MSREAVASRRQNAATEMRQATPLLFHPVSEHCLMRGVWRRSRLAPPVLVALLALAVGLLATPAADARKPAKVRPAGPVTIKSDNTGPLASPFAPAKPRARLRQAGTAKWIDGSWAYQYGTNCATAILGSSYTEPMVISYTRYGGLDHIPKVGEEYYGSIVSAVTGNPCPYGYTYVSAEALLPKGTQIVPGSIQCIGQTRSGATEVLTNSTWRDPADNRYTGNYCQTTPSQGLHGGQFLGFRPLASGQIFEIRFKLTSSQQLKGAAASPADELGAYIQSTGVYSDTTAKTWINVLPAATTDPATVYTPNPPFTNAAPATQGGLSSTTLRGLTYTGFRTGYVFFRVYDAAGTTLLFDGETSPGCRENNPGNTSLFFCRSQLNNTADLWISEQLFNFDPATAAEKYSFRLVFKNTANNQYTVGPPTVFKPWQPDADADGVGDKFDACDDKAAPESANGCPTQAPPADADQDGVPDANDARTRSRRSRGPTAARRTPTVTASATRSTRARPLRRRPRTGARSPPPGTGTATARPTTWTSAPTRPPTRRTAARWCSRPSSTVTATACRTPPTAA
jgi:hypothetical protein